MSFFTPPDAVVYVLTTVYGIAGIITFTAYWPTIVDLWKGIPSANLRTWIIFTLTDLAVFLYALLVVHDLPFILVATGNLLHAFVIVVLRYRIKTTTK